MTYEVSPHMGTVNEFKFVYRTNGLRPAVKWVDRDLITSVFHPATYLLVDLCSPFLIDQDGLEERFRANGSIEYYDQKRSFEIELPPRDGHVETFRERPGTYTIDQPFVGELQDVLLVGSSPIPVSNDKKVILEAIGNPEVLTLNIVATLREQVAGLTTKPRRDPDPIDSAVLLYNQWNRGYYHWTVETLTRLEGVETYCERTGEAPKLIVGPDPNRFQLQTLELLGYDQDDLITWDDRARRVNNLIVPSMRRDLNPGTVSPIAYQWLRDRMRTAVASEAPRAATAFSKRVYISREDAPRRQVVNEDEVLERLERYGFEKYVLSEHTVA